MNFTKLIVTTGKTDKYKGDLLVHCTWQPAKDIPKQLKSIWPVFKKGCELGDFTGKCGQKNYVYPESSEGISHFQVKRLAILGMGKAPSINNMSLVAEKLRKIGGHITKLAKDVRATKVMLCLPKLKNLGPGVVAQYLLEGMLLADYQFVKYKTDKTKDQDKGLKELKIHTESSPTVVRKGVKRAHAAAYAARTARDMANEPGNGWTPHDFAVFARELAEEFSMKCKVIEKKEMKRLKMGGILAVNQGSITPPKLIILEYNAENKGAPTLLMVGKGLTFDSGGISLKPAAGMQDMKYDMCGGAAVLSLMQAIGIEKANVNVVAIVPSTDNMSGSSALKPGDIIRHYNGLTSEIINTDAEGRLILADALAYGIKKFDPDCVVDLATLTGAVIIGLGHHYTGILGNNDKLVKRLIDAGNKCGEPLWRLPLGEEYSKQIDSKVADIKNTGGKSAGTITAAAYLQKFVGETPWAHLDIAGTAWNFTDKTYVPKGPSGVGVRTLLELVRDWPVKKVGKKNDL